MSAQGLEGLESLEGLDGSILASERRSDMGLGRALLCIFLPPLAVLDRGCGSILLVTLLTLVGWVPGVIAAIVICKK